MSRKGAIVWTSTAVLALCLWGCVPPNHVDSADAGGAIAFAMSTLPQYSIGQGSQLYAFDLDTCRLKMLSDHPGMNTWVALSPDGKEFAYTRCHSQTHFTLHRKAVGDKNERQLGAAYNAYGAPVYVPGAKPHILAFEGRSMNYLNWTAFDAEGRELCMPWGKRLKAVGTDTPGIAADRVAVPVYGTNPEYWKRNEKPYAIWIYVVDLTADKPVGVAAAKFDCYPHEAMINFLDHPTLDFAFSPDGKKLAMSWYTTAQTRFFLLDPTGKERETLLFSDKGAYRPAWTSDGRNIVYLRKHPNPAKWNSLELVMRKGDACEPVTLAELPGQVRKAGTALANRPDGRLRVAHFSNSGIALFESDADGGNASLRELKSNVLGKQKGLARFQYVFAQNPKINQWQAPYEVYRHIKEVQASKDEPREESIAKSLEVEWKALSEYERGKVTEVKSSAR